MGTGACGINCDVCWLKVAGICSTCGHGMSLDARRKLDAQIRIMGTPCPILECAVNKEIHYCMRDCALFPCSKFIQNKYPYSEGFINMQKRRKQEYPLSREPSGNIISVPPSYWDNLKAMDIDSLCTRAIVEKLSSSDLLVPFMGEYLRIEVETRSITRLKGDEWVRIDYPMLELLTLVYLLNVKDVPLSERLISVKEMKDAHFFQGPHELRIEPVVERFGHDLEGFKRAAMLLGGKEQGMADVSFRLPVFPRIPVYYLLWSGDDEFPPRVSILFDSSIEKHFQADAIWGLVNIVTDALLRAESEKQSHGQIQISH
jgi:hypothetical protein